MLKTLIINLILSYFQCVVGRPGSVALKVAAGYVILMLNYRKKIGKIAESGVNRGGVT